MLTPDDIQYAIENTKVILPPKHRLSTFGTSLVRYYLVTEEMDAINLSRVREGKIHAEKPEILSSHYFQKLMLEGFGEKAEAFAETLNQTPQNFAFLKYGFRMRKDDIRSYDVHESFDLVIDQVTQEAQSKSDPLTAVVSGIDDGWEVCLIKFMIDMIQASSSGNMEDLREKGLL